MERNVEKLEKEIKDLEELLQLKKQLLWELKAKSPVPPCPFSLILSTEEVIRYSRQLIMPEIGISNQISLKRAKVLVVGAGGLGCPASLYLAAAGVGEIHVADYDDAELSNLHRQILHYETDIGRSKAKSVCEKLMQINSNVKAVPLNIHADSSIHELVKKNAYYVILDCTDNVPTRYLLNDVSVLCKIPLVSGSALKMEGQLTVYNYRDGPCYRCIFPTPPPPETVTNCGDGGVLGAVPGVIGVLQALEAIKVILDRKGVLYGRLLLFDAADTTFRTIKLRNKSSKCDICGANPTIDRLIDYEQFCGSKAHDKIVDVDLLAPDESIDVLELPKLLESHSIVIDVRSICEYAMCQLPGTLNVPYSTFRPKDRGFEAVEDILKESDEPHSLPVYLLCRRGNDSQRAAVLLKEKFAGLPVHFINVRGGLTSYSKLVDNSFPIY